MCVCIYIYIYMHTLLQYTKQFSYYIILYYACSHEDVKDHGKRTCPWRHAKDLQIKQNTNNAQTK